MFTIKKISWSSFSVGAGAGFVLGALVLGLAVNYLVSRALSDQATGELLFGSSVKQVREGIMMTEERRLSKTVYGHVVSIGGGTLVLSAVQPNNTKKNLTFIYDKQTVFVYLAHDDASTETPFSSDAIVLGDGLTVTTNEPVASVENQRAVKVTKI